MEDGRPRPSQRCDGALGFGRWPPARPARTPVLDNLNVDRIMNTAQRKPQFVASIPVLIITVILAGTAVAQERHERTIDEIKTEAIKRAENGMYPLIGLDPADVREALASVKTRDKDEWAAAFMVVADKYATEAKALEATDPQKANADYIRAWRLYSFGRWPFPASPKKQESYHKAIAAFLA